MLPCLSLDLSSHPQFHRHILHKLGFINRFVIVVAKNEHYLIILGRLPEFSGFKLGIIKATVSIL